MSWIEIIADRKIRDAQDEGSFDNLPGKGKPLKLEFDPRVPADQRAAYRLMREANFLPDWIQLEKEIRRREEAWSERLDTYARSRETELSAASSRRERHRAAEIDARRDRVLLRAAEELGELNRMIERLNLIVPTPSRQRRRIPPGERLSELEARFPRLEPYPSGAAPWEPLLQEASPGAARLSNRMPMRRRRGSIG